MSLLPFRRIWSSAAVLLVLAACADEAPTGVPGTVSYSTSTGPVLVECPTDQSATAVGEIGLLGGRLEAAGSVLDVPSGAVLVPQEFALTVPAAQYMEVDVSAVGLDSYTFESPVTITIDYSRCTRSNINKASLTVWHIDPVSKALLQQMPSTDDKVNRRITFTTDHLSTYAVAE